MTEIVNHSMLYKGLETRPVPDYEAQWPVLPPAQSLFNVAGYTEAHRQVYDPQCATIDARNSILIDRVGMWYGRFMLDLSYDERIQLRHPSPARGYEFIVTPHLKIIGAEYDTPNNISRFIVAQLIDLPEVVQIDHLLGALGDHSKTNSFQSAMQKLSVVAATDVLFDVNTVAQPIPPFRYVMRSCIRQNVEEQDIRDLQSWLWHDLEPWVEIPFASVIETGTLDSD